MLKATDWPCSPTLGGASKPSDAFVKELGVPVFVLMGQGCFKKPATDMWEHLEQQTLDGATVDRAASFFVGDGDVDAEFARRLQVRFVHVRDFFVPPGGVDAITRAMMPSAGDSSNQRQRQRTLMRRAMRRAQEDAAAEEDAPGRAAGSAEDRAGPAEQAPKRARGGAAAADGAPPHIDGSGRR